MALLLPLIWERWMLLDQHETLDDPLPPVQMLSGVPAYSLDQFTRIGNTISRALLRADPDLQGLLDEAGVRPGAQPRAIGDLLFLLEGGLVGRRTCWPIGDRLRLPWRCLASTVTLQNHVAVGLEHLRQRGSKLARLRVEYFLLVD